MSAILPPFPFIEGGYGCIVADPAWRFSDKNTRGAAEKHYATMSNREIIRMPVEDLAAKNAHLYLWTTDAHLEIALAAIRAWDFNFKLTIPWIKAKDGKLQMGTGHYFRHAHELCLFAVRGKCPGLNHSLLSVFFAERQAHSAKPDELQALAEQMSPPPGLELFARRQRLGWAAWGLESGVEAPQTRLVHDPKQGGADMGGSLKAAAKAMIYDTPMDAEYADREG